MPLKHHLSCFYSVYMSQVNHHILPIFRLKIQEECMQACSESVLDRCNIFMQISVLLSCTLSFLVWMWPAPACNIHGTFLRRNYSSPQTCPPDESWVELLYYLIHSENSQLTTTTCWLTCKSSRTNSQPDMADKYIARSSWSLCLGRN